MTVAYLLDLPTEIIRDYLFPHLDNVDLLRLWQTGNTRLKEIVKNYQLKQFKHKLNNIFMKKLPQLGQSSTFRCKKYYCHF